MRPVVENYEIHAKKSDPDEVANSMRHSRLTQVNQYLQNNTYEDTTQYVERRVSVPISAAKNKGTTITGTMGSNDGKQTDSTPGEMPYSVVFDRNSKSPTSMCHFPTRISRVWMDQHQHPRPQTMLLLLRRNQPLKQPHEQIINAASPLNVN